MMIRKAEEREIPRIMELLGQVLQIHADIRPDIFIPGTTKYTADELNRIPILYPPGKWYCNKFFLHAMPKHMRLIIPVVLLVWIV